MPIPKAKQGAQALVAVRQRGKALPSGPPPALLGQPSYANVD